ncbi:MAG: 16S rRNA (cytidine(1402)-2'-O)-methyltransferase [Deltaproteobacteria bacterium]|nr:16S rRNA (cytidine(1402)-2'-O)-methyltransferase [Deltaproteobacteria bacterium]
MPLTGHTDRAASRRLYVVATPIGNLEDITFRAIHVLKSVDFIAAEDTRRTRKLLSHYRINNRLVAYHSHNRLTSGPRILKRLQDGACAALTTDGGTPLISDPGLELIGGALASGIEVVPIPGPSAVTTALSAAGFPATPHLFLGFLPAKRGNRMRQLKDLEWSTHTIIAFEAPHRIHQTLRDLEEVFGQRRMVLAREMTKVHETFLRGSAAEISRSLGDGKVQGEITLLIEGTREQPESEESILEELDQLIRRTGVPLKDAIGQVARARGVPKRVVYEESLKLDRTGLNAKRTKPSPDEAS